MKSIETYKPHPINTDNIILSAKLEEMIEQIVANIHEVWSQKRIGDGWIYGATRDDFKKRTPCLVPYNNLPKSEREYDRKIAQSILKFMLHSGFKIIRDTG